MDKLEELISYTKSLKLLYVEDEEDVRRSTLSILQDFFDDIIVAHDGKDGLDKYLEHLHKENQFNLIITDINMPNLNGLEMITEIKRLDDNIAIVVFSALQNSKYFVECIKQNITGYIIKPLDLTQLIGVLESVMQSIQIKRSQLKIRQEKEVLEVYAYHDELTGLPNRLLFNDRLEQGIKKAKRNSAILGIFFIDLNKFKYINDTLGHEVGDYVLKTVGNLMQKCMRDEDTLSRIGGDEFTIIMQDINRPEDTLLLANKILDTIHKPISYKGINLSISASIGISIYPDNHDDAAKLLQYADLAMYEAKKSTNNNIVLHTKKNV